jgi:hypothetical protein
MCGRPVVHWSAVAMLYKVVFVQSLVIALIFYGLQLQKEEEEVTGGQIW